MSVAELNLAAMRANRLGILSMVAGVGAFVINDSIVKLASESLNSGQLIFIRGAFATCFILAMVRATGALRQPAMLVSRPVVLRALVDAAATFTYLAALFNMPIANITAINLSSPLILTALAVVFLKELVGWRRWLAIAVGFVGVLMVIQPSADGFNSFALLALFATFLHAARDIVTRYIAADVPSLVATLATAVSVTFLALGLSVFEGWRPVGRTEFGLLLLASIFLAAGYHLIVVAMRHGEMSLVGPFRYTALIWAVLLGYVLWGEIPNLLASAGILLLIASGLYALYRERVVGARG